MDEIINRDHLDGWSEPERVFRLSSYLVMPGDFVFMQDAYLVRNPHQAL